MFLTILISYFSSPELKQKMAVELTKPRYADPAFSFPPDTPVIPLDAREAFQKLTDKERLYSHYMSRASYYGGLVVLIQTSPESPQVKLLRVHLFLVPALPFRASVSAFGCLRRRTFQAGS